MDAQRLGTGALLEHRHTSACSQNKFGKCMAEGDGRSFRTL
jgi:hypothetical protein